MIEPNPFETDTTLRRIRVLRRSRFLALRTEEVLEQDIRRQLTDLDNAIIGTNARELRELRAWAQRLRPEERVSGRMRMSN